MSILDTFAIVFESNADQVKKAEEEATASGQKLEAALGATDTAGVKMGAAVANAGSESTIAIASAVEALEVMQAQLNAMPAHELVGTVAASSPAATEAAIAAQKELQVVEKETGKVGVASLDEVTEHTGFLAKGFDELKEHAEEWKDKFLEQALEVGAAFYAIFEVEKLVDNFFEQAESSDQLGEFSKSLGLNIEDVDAWGNAVKRVGGTAEGFQGSLRNLEFRLERVRLAATGGGKGGDRSARFFKALGIDAAHVKEPFALLDELAKKVDGMDKTKSGALLRGIGLDEGTIRLLQSGNKEVAELVERQKMLGVVTKEDAETAEAFNREWDDVKQLFRNITIDADTAFLPILEDILKAVEAFIEFCRDHKDMVVGFFAAIGVALAVLINEFGLLDFLASPWIALAVAIIAASVAIGLLYDDVKAYVNGQNSLLGELLKPWPSLKAAIDQVIYVVQELWHLLTESPAKALKEIESDFGEVGQAVKAVVDLVQHLIDLIGKLSLTGFLKELGFVTGKVSNTQLLAIPQAPGQPALHDDTPDAPAAPTPPPPALRPEDFPVYGRGQPSATPGQAASAAPAMPGQLPPETAAGVQAGQAQIDATRSPEAAGLVSKPSSSVVNNVTNAPVVNIGGVTVNAGQTTDPAALGDAIHAHLQGHYETVLNDHMADGMVF